MVKKDSNVKIVSILAYFLIGIIWYFADGKVRKNQIAKFHVKQALNLFIINVVLSIVASMFLFGLFGLLSGIINLAMLVFWILGLINAINQNKAAIPIIGQFAEKYLRF